MKAALCVLALTAMGSSAFPAVPPAERDALVALYQATEGPAWSRSQGWLGLPDTECTWEGVICDDAQATVISLELSSNNLKGTLPPAFYRLPNLSALYLDYNGVAGNFTDLLQFPALRDLELSYSNFGGGPWPIQLTQLAELRRLGLAGLGLTGSIPTEIRALTHLDALYAQENLLSGTLPVELTQLVGLRELFLYRNELTGSIPPSFANLMNLETLLLGANRFEGPFPAQLLSLTRLQVLQLGENRFEGPLPAGISGLTRLNDFSVAGNRFSGSIPAELFELPGIVSIELSQNEFTGRLPLNIAVARTLEHLNVAGNHIEGDIPLDIGSLPSLIGLSLSSNRFTGTIPSTISQLARLQSLNLSANALRGPVPPVLQQMTALADGESDFTNNALFTADPSLRAFLNAKQSGGDWESTQTVPPTDVGTLTIRGRSAVLTWKPILYSYDEGGYQIAASKTPGGTVAATVTSSDKFQTTATIEGLEPQTLYFFRLRTITFAHEFQQNTLASDFAPEISATTTADVPSPPLIVITEPPTGMLQRGAGIEREDYFALTNFGETSSALTVSRTGNFFEITPLTFEIGPGETFYVSLTPLPQPPGVYSGAVGIEGVGVTPGVRVAVVLLSAPATEGDVLVVPSATRVDVGDEAVGSVTFTNTGTIPLAGLISAGEPWIRASSDAVFIAPGSSARADFSIDATARPDGQDPVGAVSGNLSLLYLDSTQAASGALQAAEANAAATPGVSVAPVQVVHTVAAKPIVGGPAPPAVGEVVRFLPGVAHLTRRGRALISDVFVANASGTLPLRDITLQFVPARRPPELTSGLPEVAPTASFQFGDVVRTFSRDEVFGSLILRTPRWNDLAAGGRLVSASGPAGEIATQLPVFRSDRGAGAGEVIALPGVSRDSVFRTDLFVQETSGRPASVQIEFFAPSGSRVGTARPPDPVAAYGLLEFEDLAPEGAVSATVTNTEGSTGRVAAYAMVVDTRTADGTTVNDWSRYFDVDLTAPVRVPLVTSGAPATRRRPIVRAGISKIEASDEPMAAVTDVVVFNPGTDEAAGTIRYFESGARLFEQSVNLGPHASLVLRDAAAALVKSSRATAGQLVVEPSAGRLAVSARRYQTSAAGTTGSEVPAVDAYSGLRAGQTRLFAAVNDCAPSAVRERRPGTSRADLIIAESEGSAMVVRVRILYRTGRSAYATLQSRDFEIGPRRVVSIPNISASVIGAERERLGDLLNLQLEVEVISGDGGATIILLATDNGTADQVLRLE